MSGAIRSACRHRRLVRGLLAAGAAGIVAQRLGRGYGAGLGERTGVLPGDEVVDRPMAVTTHAVTIEAPPAEVWPWLVQMGWHRAGWYTAPWVDRLLFPANLPSTDRIVPELQALAVGDEVPDGTPESGCVFVVEQLEPEDHLVLHSTRHLPPRWAERFGAWIDWSWAFVLDDLCDGRTRLVVRSRLRTGPWWVALGYALVIVPADFVMCRQMLGGIKERAEARHGSIGAALADAIRSSARLEPEARLEVSA